MTNNELRRRKLKDQNGKPPPNRKRKEIKTDSLQRSFLCFLISGGLLTLFLLLYVDSIPWYLGHQAVDKIAKNFGYHKPVYAVVIDAGSTGSRVLAFSFHESYFGNHLILDKELFKESKPGLSAFVDDPQKGAATIANLLEEAKREIPKEYWRKTPLILKATAGLRLLPSQKADNLLNAVKDLFRRSPFLTNDKSVEIMEGTDEGIFSWFTVNFLLDTLNGNPAKTVAALDLGGGSMQVTFAALAPSSLAQKQYIHESSSPRGIIPLYTHSYLLGLHAVRHAVFTLNQGSNTNITSECVNHIIKDRPFYFANVKYHISGPEKDYPKSQIKGNDYWLGEEFPIVNFKKCAELVDNYVTSKAMPPAELPSKFIVAFSYFFDKPAEAGVIDIEKGGTINVLDFEKAARKVCHEPNADTPFLCLDLTIMWKLLEKGLGLSMDTPLSLLDTIKGHEISWALGAAYNTLRG